MYRTEKYRAICIRPSECNSNDTDSVLLEERVLRINHGIPKHAITKELLANYKIVHLIPLLDPLCHTHVPCDCRCCPDPKRYTNSNGQKTIVFFHNMMNSITVLRQAQEILTQKI